MSTNNPTSCKSVTPVALAQPLPAAAAAAATAQAAPAEVTLLWWAAGAGHALPASNAKLPGSDCEHQGIDSDTSSGQRHLSAIAAPSWARSLRQAAVCDTLRSSGTASVPVCAPGLGGHRAKRHRRPSARPWSAAGAPTAGHAPLATPTPPIPRRAVAPAGANSAVVNSSQGGTYKSVWYLKVEGHAAAGSTQQMLAPQEACSSGALAGRTRSGTALQGPCRASDQPQSVCTSASVASRRRHVCACAS